MYETLQSIVDQLEFCDYQTKDGHHELKMNAGFIALKKRAAQEKRGETFEQWWARREGYIKSHPAMYEECYCEPEPKSLAKCAWETALNSAV